MAHRLRVLGPPEVLDAAGNPVSLSLGKPLAVLVYVACSSSPVSRDELADLLWPDADRQKGRHSVRQALWVLKNALGDDIFDGNEPLSIREGALELDLARFAKALKDGRVEDAIALWQGPVLDHFVLAGVRHWNHWAEDLRGDLEHRFCKALLSHARSLAADGDTTGAVSALDQAIEVSPVAEAPHLARIELLLDLLRLDAAREALADAHQTLGDHQESVPRLAAMEERLAQVIKEQRARIEEGETFPMEFVGRSRELAGLQSLWREAHTGLTRTAVVTGPSGIGKTRLAQELLSYVSGQEVRTVALKGTRAGMKLRWGAASDLVREALRLPGSAGISSASDSLLRAMLPSLGKGSSDLRAINGMSPAAFLDAVSDLLEAVSFEVPLVVLVDDFQWLDRDSRTLFMGLASRCRELRVLFLILGRSDLSSRHWEEVETSLVSEAGARRFLLESLIEEEVGELLALGAAFPNLEDAKDVVRRIHQASAGNPLFIREILKELHEKRILVREGPGWAFLTSEIPEAFELPENLRVLLQERLDRLSEAAASLAATLAKARRRTPPEVLQRETQLPKGVFGKAVAELLERGVIEWVGGTTLDFVHDVLRDTAASHLSGSLPEPIKKPRASLPRRLAIPGALLIGVAAVTGVLSFDQWGPEASVPPPRYGGGTILLRRADDITLALGVDHRATEDWEEISLTPPPGGVRNVFRGREGALVWIGMDDAEDGPDVVRVLDDGTRQPLAWGPGDQAPDDLSPDGTRFLFRSENVGHETFGHSMYWAPLDNALERHLVYAGQGPLGSGRFSPDGDMVAINAVGANDSLAVVSLDGDRLYSREFDEIYGIEWCGGGIAVAADQDRETALFHIRPREDEVEELAPLLLPVGGLYCSPDQTTLLHIGLESGRATLILRDLGTGEVEALSGAEVRSDTPTWLPDSLPVVPMRVRAQKDTLWMEWGGNVEPVAAVAFSDGSLSEEGLWWEALDPDIVSLNPEGLLVGNQAGVGRVLARWRHSLKDTVVVVVEDTGQSGSAALYRGDWSLPMDSVWIPFGLYPPTIEDLPDGPVLRLQGAEKYNDGLLYRDSLQIDQGITIELEFQMELTGVLHQNLRLCLQDYDLDNLDLELGVFLGQGDSLCFAYPSREAAKLDRSEVSLLVSPGVEARARVPESLPTQGWTHVAIQVRADGECSLVVNRERVATCPILLRTVPIHRWTVKLSGDAVDTQVNVRNLNIWKEVRY